MGSQTKQCTACERVLPLELFNRDRHSSQRRRSHCKTCQEDERRDYRKRKKLGLIEPRITPTKAAAILELLMDDLWHTTEEVREAGGISYNSRISVLKSEGHQIIRKRDYGSAGGWLYRLVDDPLDPDLKELTSPKEKLFDLLKDGKWHSNEELMDLMDRSYPDHMYFLRKDGFTISKKRDQETGCWCYKLET